MFHGISSMKESWCKDEVAVKKTFYSLELLQWIRNDFNDKNNVAAYKRIWQNSFLGPLLLTLFNLNPGIDKLVRPLYSVGWKYLSITKLQRCNRWSLGIDK